MNNSEVNQSPGLARWKRVFFWIILLLVPVLIFSAAELLLKGIDYDGDLDLVVRRTAGGREVYSINRSVGLRYFGRSSPIVPEPADDTFEIVKSDTTIRIFCLGESTMAGFPYEFNATAPSLLRDRLAIAFPHRRIEVVNVGLSAVGSYVVLDFLRELSRYQPDLFIVYVGHNEFYGAYGIGSTVGIGGNPVLTRFAINLLRFKTFLALRDFISWIRGGHPAGGNGATLMGEVVRSKAIPYGSQTYRTALRGYEQNLQLMIDVAKDHHIPIVFSTLISNIRDQPPFHSDFDPGTSATAREQWNQELEEGQTQLAGGKIADALQYFAAAVSLDSSNAKGQFLLGRTLFRTKEWMRARQSFTRAKDFDQLRFRASEDFQRALRNICEINGTPVAPTDSLFEAVTPSGIVGNELILEHLHPNIRGYNLLAKSFWQAIRANHYFAGETEWSRVKDLPDGAYSQVSYVTRFDTLVGLIRVDLLTHRWPFVDAPSAPTFSPKDSVEELASEYVAGKVAWSSARYELSEYYLRHGVFDLARQECLAVAKVIPFSYQPLLRVADYYAIEGRKREAADAYRKCIEREDNSSARIKLAILLLDGGNPRTAKDQLDRAAELTQEDAHANSSEVATIYYLLAVANANLGDFTGAKQSIQHSFAFVPNFTQSAELLRQIEAVEGRRDIPHK